jgi:hypothetical protein
MLMLNTVRLNTEERLYRFLQEHGDNRVKRELLLFWGMHPNARFDRRAVCYALDCNKLDAEMALGTMVDEGLLDKDTCNGVTLYLLTAEEERRRAVLELAALSWDQWQSMLRCVWNKETG